MAVPYFVLLSGGVENMEVYLYIGLSYITIIGIAGFGYLTNDYADREKDQLANKPNALIGMNPALIVGLFVLFLGLALVPWFFFPTRPISFILLGAELLLFVLYAFPPFRLKEKGLVGVVVDALYAHVIPATLACYTFWLMRSEPMWSMQLFIICYGGFQFFLGIRNILLHQLKDRESDLASGTRTLATKWPVKRMTNLLITAMVLEVLFIAGFIVAFMQFIPGIGIAGVVLLGFWSFKLWNNYVKHNGFGWLNHKTIAHDLLDDFYTLWLPVIFLILMVLSPTAALPVLGAHVLLFPNVVKQVFLKVFWKCFKILPGSLQGALSGRSLAISIPVHLVLAAGYLIPLWLIYSHLMGTAVHGYAFTFYNNFFLSVAILSVLVHLALFIMVYQKQHANK